MNLSWVKDKYDSVGDTSLGGGGFGWESNLMATDREQRTIRAMMEIYCHAHHAEKRGLCEECLNLYEYAQARLGKCPFGPDKPVCAKCPIHCYRADMRDRIRDVMKFAGPRMALRHPGLAVAHLIQQRKPAPERPGKTGQPRVTGGSDQKCHGCGDIQD